jgi:hypothetical protein
MTAYSDYDTYTDPAASTIVKSVYQAGKGQALTKYAVVNKPATAYVSQGGYGSCAAWDDWRNNLSKSVSPSPPHTLPEHQRNYRISAAIADMRAHGGVSTVLVSPDPQAGMTMLDAACQSAGWLFYDSYGMAGRGWQNVTVGAAPTYTLSATPTSDPDYGGCTFLNHFGETEHSLCFGFEPMHDMLELLASPYADMTSPHFGMTYRAWIADYAQRVKQVLYWRDFGGTTNWTVPAPSGDGSYTRGPIGIADDGHRTGLSHRWFSSAVTRLMCWKLCGSTDAPMYWLYTHYLAVGMSTINSDGTTNETGTNSGPGYDSSYGAATGYMLDWMYAIDPEPATLNALIANAAWENSRIATDGTLNQYGNHRVNEFVQPVNLALGDPNYEYRGEFTGMPVVLLRGTQNIYLVKSPTDPHVFEWRGDTLQSSPNQPKGGDYLRICVHMASAGAIANYVNSSDNGWPARGALCASKAAYNFIAPGSQPTAATPGISPNGGSLTGAQTVALSCATPGSTMYYTLDGSTPTTSSTLYAGPFAVGVSLTVKAIAVAGGYQPSAVASAAFTIKVPTPSMSPGAGTFTAAQSVSLSCPMAGASFYYTTDGTTPTTGSTLYAGPIAVAASETIKAIAVIAGCTASDVTTAAYVINLTLSQAATPSISPDGYSGPTPPTVTLACSQDGTTIRYTTDGTAPGDGSPEYSAPFALAMSATVQAIAAAAGFADSAVAVAMFDIALVDADAPVISPATGIYPPGTLVTISSDQVGAAIYYTTDGTAPTAGSTLYVAPFAVNGDTVINAIAIVAGFAPSVVTSDYFIVPPVRPEPAIMTSTGTMPLSLMTSTGAV